MTEETQINEIDAKAGRRVKGMPYVLGLSLVGAIVLSVIVLAAFAG